MLVSQSEFIDIFLNINMEEERKKRIKEREERIKYEFSLYRCFCKLFGLKQCELSSYKLFETYCSENKIELL